METVKQDKELLERYVAAFKVFDELSGHDVPKALRVGPDRRYGGYRWRPKPLSTNPSALEELCRALSSPDSGAVVRLPPLYATLILSYQWMRVDLGTYSLLGNLPGDGLQPLLDAIQEDRLLHTVLQRHGYVRFGAGPLGDYDPLCFDCRRRRSDGDCRIVKLDHEAILCHERIGDIAEVAPSFRALVQETLDRADRHKTR